MSIATGDTVRFVYITGTELPATVNDSTVYFVAGSTPPAIYVGSNQIGSVDTEKWNSVGLTRTATVPQGDITTWYIPYVGATTDTEAHYINVKRTGTSGAGIAAYNSDGRLLSVTPTSGDNSTLVATTAFVKAAIDGIIDTDTTYTLTQDGNSITLTGTNGDMYTVTVDVPTDATFDGTEATLSVSGTPSGNVGITVAESATGNYTPAGSVSVTPSVSLDTTKINTLSSAGTLPSYTLPTLEFIPQNDGNLNINWSQGTFLAGSLPQGVETDVATGVDSATATGSFTGTKVNITGSFTGSNSTFTGTYTPEGDVTLS